MRVRRTVSRRRRAHNGPVSKEQYRERRLELLIRYLPPRFQFATRWLRRPAVRWLRISAGSLLIVASRFGLLIQTLWRLPLGLVLLSDDVTPLRRFSDCILAWTKQRHPSWMGCAKTPACEKGMLSTRALGGHPRMTRGRNITAVTAKGHLQYGAQRLRSRGTSDTYRWRSA
jgi:hypothetical protein